MTSLVLDNTMQWLYLRLPRWPRKDGLVSFSFSGQLCRGLSASRTSLNFQGPAATQESPILVSRSHLYSARALVEIAASTTFPVYRRLRIPVRGPTTRTSSRALRWRVKALTMWHHFPSRLLKDLWRLARSRAVFRDAQRSRPIQDQEPTRPSPLLLQDAQAHTRHRLSEQAASRRSHRTQESRTPTLQPRGRTTRNLLHTPPT
mmetsp:Transcript_15705/g.37896  ORF Transcript_15705/g.37896 Transcript_15705/m.37896 type:complete len:204 (+) Transcript_15705:815-1426(+)